MQHIAPGLAVASDAHTSRYLAQHRLRELLWASRTAQVALQDLRGYVQRASDVELLCR